MGLGITVTIRIEVRIRVRVVETYLTFIAFHSCRGEVASDRDSSVVGSTQVNENAKLVNLNHCAVPFLSCAAVNLSWYNSTYKIL